ncbi:pentatricopeptide repeat-containing protein [Pyrus ussuriensis x Pyrus communis]|uniref:Pentatricopeptide repeat-containing protein n=1 Tax=Pyrus ussuriensis x Pyrus communis TaxID=2448454 RepID=A0A5N5HTG6_9ROSA|nr:pentatricopeptide repeat-containing protein [Pyrus ussuriensis x Pyrus communis]
MQLILHFQSQPVLAKQSLCFSYPFVKTKTSLPSNLFAPKSPIFTIPLSRYHQIQTHNPILCARKNKRRNGSQRLTRLLLQLMPAIVSNFKILPQPLDLVVEEFCSGDGSGGRKSLLLFLLYGVLVICGLGLLFGGDVESNVLFCGLGFGLSGVAMVQWLDKIGIFAIFFGGVLLSRLVDFCTNSEARDLGYAKKVFQQISQPSVYIWNSMIRGYSNSENPVESLIMYREMLQRGYLPDNFTFPFVLKSCSVIADYRYGKCVHNCIVKTGYGLEVYGSTCLLRMYASCADMESALKVFDIIPKWNVVAWTSLISGFVNNSRAIEAIKVFKDMELHNVQPNEITMVHVVVACARSRDIDTGKLVHSRIRQLGFDPFGSSFNFNVVLATALLDMGSVQQMAQKNLVTWNSMISAYNQYGWAEEAIDLFSDMRIAGFVPDQTTFLGVIGACAQLGALAFGRSLHSYVSKTSMCKDTTIGTALVDMYAKIGDAGSARRIFENLQKKDVMAWTSMIICLATHGHGMEALHIFRKMQEDASVIPDQITYIGVLSACSHIGLVEEGQRHFASMVNLYGIKPTADHYCCMVDLLSRAGRFDEAMRLLEEMPIQPNVAVWGALLNGCEIHENVDLADQVRRYITEMEPHGSGVYVLLSNIYARAGRWQEVNRVRELMKNRNIAKNLGHSSVEMELLSS